MFESDDGMSRQASSLEPLVTFIARSRGLSMSAAGQIVAEVLAYLDETSRDFVLRRHRELQQAGSTNAEIFAVLQEELAVHRFRAEPLSDRQLRRLIYG